MKVKLLRNKLGPDRDPGHKAYVAAGHPDYGVIAVPKEVHALLLVAKLHEEAEEIREDMTNVEEYADLYQALFDLAKLNGVAWRDIGEAAYKKQQKKGDFSEPRLLVKE